MWSTDVVRGAIGLGVCVGGGGGLESGCDGGGLMEGLVNWLGHCGTVSGYSVGCDVTGGREYMGSIPSCGGGGDM